MLKPDIIPICEKLEINVDDIVDRDPEEFMKGKGGEDAVQMRFTLYQKKRNKLLTVLQNYLSGKYNTHERVQNNTAVTEGSPVSKTRKPRINFKTLTVKSSRRNINTGLGTFLPSISNKDNQQRQ